MLEPCERQGSFCVYGFIVGSPDWGGRRRVSPCPVAIEAAPIRVQQGGRGGQQERPGEFAAPRVIGAGHAHWPKERL